jgi:hypothetical protein
MLVRSGRRQIEPAPANHLQVGEGERDRFSIPKQELERDTSRLPLWSESTNIKRAPTMIETIRFAWGISSLGDFVVAMSDKGIVALEFSSLQAAMEDALQARFPDVNLERSQEALADIVRVVATVIDNPAISCDVPLDLRGTPFEIKVWHMLLEIPIGQTISYGELAAKLGTRE